MIWQTFQNESFDLTKKEVNKLSRDVLKYYTDARRSIEDELETLYLKYLTGIPPEDYYNTIIKRDILKKTLARVTADYNAFSRKAGGLMGRISQLAMSNTYYRKLYATQWLAPELAFGYLPQSLIELTAFSTSDSWKKITARIKETYGELSNYTSKAGTLTSILVSDRQKQVKAIQKAITVGLQQGKSYTMLTNDIKDIIGKEMIKDGVKSVSGAKANAMRIIRTESNRTLNAGSYAQSKYAADQGIDIMRMLSSVLDNRTRRQSAIMDGQKVGVDEGFRYPGVSEPVMYPGTSGVAKYDINDRETVVDIVDGEDPQLRRGRNPTTDKDNPNYGKNEVFSYKDFDTWAKDNNLKKNIYGEYVQK